MIKENGTEAYFNGKYNLPFILLKKITFIFFFFKYKIVMVCDYVDKRMRKVKSILNIAMKHLQLYIAC